MVLNSCAPNAQSLYIKLKRSVFYSQPNLAKDGNTKLLFQMVTNGIIVLNSTTIEKNKVPFHIVENGRGKKVHFSSEAGWEEKGRSIQTCNKLLLCVWCANNQKFKDIRPFNVHLSRILSRIPKTVKFAIFFNFGTCKCGFSKVIICIMFPSPSGGEFRETDT